MKLETESSKDEILGDYLNTIYFGRREDADEQTARVRNIHSRIRGELPERAGRFPAGLSLGAGVGNGA